MARSISLPAERLRIASDIPAVCIRHGLSGGAIQRRRITFVSKTPVWVYPICVIAIVVGIVIAFILRVSIASPSWPACDSCRKIRMTNLAAMSGSLLIWIPLSWFAASVAEAKLLAILAFVLMPFAALCFAIAGSWSSILKAHVARDGTTVTFDNPHHAFVSELTPHSPVPAIHEDVSPEVTSKPSLEDYSYFGG